MGWRRNRDGTRVRLCDVVADLDVHVQYLPEVKPLR
jgi:hypothetical protein